mmetsp:Transcript_18505/g.51112  ORF Transcript_18505/g.51112 Transcript_18505/m.51112 type:complete len:243 (+) Transcript_18505:532-1260(+)
MDLPHQRPPPVAPRGAGAAAAPRGAHARGAGLRRGRRGARELQPDVQGRAQGVRGVDAGAGARAARQAVDAQVQHLGAGAAAGGGGAARRAAVAAGLPRQVPARHGAAGQGPRGPLPRHAALQRPHHWRRRALGRNTRAHTPRRQLCQARGVGAGALRGAAGPHVRALPRRLRGAGRPAVPAGAGVAAGAAAAARGEGGAPALRHAPAHRPPGAIHGGHVGGLRCGCAAPTLPCCTCLSRCP